jgi:hypothetical protein
VSRSTYPTVTLSGRSGFGWQTSSFSSHLCFHDVNDRNFEPDLLRQFGGEEIVGEHALMLRVVLELDDIKVAVVGAHQMALRSAAHTLDMLNRLDRQSDLANVASIAEFRTIRIPAA